MSVVLVGYDGSAAAGAALARAIAEARDRHARLVVVAVAELPLDPTDPRHFGTLGDGPATRPSAGAPPEIQRTLAEAAGRVEAAGVHGTFEWATGDPGAVLAEEATRTGAVLVVVGEHHHGWFGRLTGADVAAELRRRLDCEVVTAGV